MLVYTKTDESDVGNIKPGEEVTFKVGPSQRTLFVVLSAKSAWTRPHHKACYLRLDHRIRESGGWSYSGNDRLRNHPSGHCAERTESGRIPLFAIRRLWGRRRFSPSTSSTGNLSEKLIFLISFLLLSSVSRHGQMETYKYFCLGAG